ncbi:DUF6086 family protein [Streptomyces pseudovenezuelae]|nr:DUF6086 family protein [Streptomyces pseudovenezuelae]
MYFDISDETLWNPSNSAGRLFLRQVEVFEAELKLASGIGQGKYWGDPDTLEVDPVVYAEFARGLVAWHCQTGHSVILTLSEGSWRRRSRSRGARESRWRCPNRRPAIRGVASSATYRFPAIHGPRQPPSPPPWIPGRGRWTAGWPAEPVHPKPPLAGPTP